MMLNLDKNCNTAFHEIGITVFHKRAPLSFYHRRTGNFSPGRGGDGYPFAKTFSQVTKIFTKQLKRNDGHTMHYISMVRSVSFSDSELAYPLALLISAMILTPLLPHGAAELSFQSAQLTK